MSTLSVVEIEKAANVMKLLGDKTRLAMMKLLDHHDYCVCEFVAIFGASQPSISQHVRKLKDVGLIGESRKGQWIIYSINKESEFYPLIQSLLPHLPDQTFRIKELKEQGLRISCE